LLLVHLVALAGCHAILPLAEPPARDDTSPDVASAVDARTEAAVQPDTSADASVGDGPPKADAPLSGDQGPLTCQQMYGTAPQFLPCSETATSCVFFTYLGASGHSTCNDVCAIYSGGQGKCLNGWDGETQCKVTTPEGCDPADIHEDPVCECSKF
jgi:hypothetical protein